MISKGYIISDADYKGAKGNTNWCSGPNQNWGRGSGAAKVVFANKSHLETFVKLGSVLLYVSQPPWETNPLWERLSPCPGTGRRAFKYYLVWDFVKVGEEDEDLRELAKFSFQRAAQNGRADCKLVTMQWKCFGIFQSSFDCWCFSSLSFRLSLRAQATWSIFLIAQYAILQSNEQQQQ